MSLRNLLLASLASSAAAVKLLVTSYHSDDVANGTITTLDFTPGLAEGASSASLKTVATNNDCNSAPTWLDFSLGTSKIICLDEGFATPNATLVTLALQSNGSLKALHTLPTIQGPVSTQFYNNNTALALAHYGGSAISTFRVSSEGVFTPLQNFTYDNSTRGPRPQQDTSHVHEAIIDPTGQYLLFPDLGLDAVHIYRADPKTAILSVLPDLKSPTGSGPRHAAFWKTGESTFLFIIHELNSAIISYKVSYPTAGGIKFDEVDRTTSYGNSTVPAGAAAAEITISPDNKFLIASNRNATLQNVPNPDPKNSTQVPSDSVATFKPCADTGKLTFVQLAPSGGKFPRHFSTNKDGSMIAVANQNSLNVDIYARDVASGKLGSKLASAFGLPGSGLTNVRWLE